MAAPTKDRLRKWARRIARPAWLGTLRRTTPLSNYWGEDRGTPIGRYYIDQFLDTHRSDIRGHVLEVKDSGYTTRYGTEVRRADVIDINPANPAATIVADLAAADSIPADSFDCFICTQTLHLIYNLRGAIAHVHRILKSGGVLLLTVPSLAKIDNDGSPAGDYWRLTVESCALLFGEDFGADNVGVQGFGNVLVAIACLAGMAREELSVKELDTYDEFYPVMITVRAVKH